MSPHACMLKTTACAELLLWVPGLCCSSTYLCCFACNTFIFVTEFPFYCTCSALACFSLTLRDGKHPEHVDLKGFEAVFLGLLVSSLAEPAVKMRVLTWLT